MTDRSRMMLKSPYKIAKTLICQKCNKSAHSTLNLLEQVAPHFGGHSAPTKRPPATQPPFSSFTFEAVMSDSNRGGTPDPTNSNYSPSQHPVMPSRRSLALFSRQPFSRSCPTLLGLLLLRVWTLPGPYGSSRMGAPGSGKQLFLVIILMKSIEFHK